MCLTLASVQSGEREWVTEYDQFINLDVAVQCVYGLWKLPRYIAGSCTKFACYTPVVEPSLEMFM